MYASVVGNLGGKPEIKQTKNGKDYLKLSIAETVGWGDNKRTQWYLVSYYGRVPDFFLELDKGDKVFICGETTLGVYENKPQAYITAQNINVVSTKPKPDGGGGKGSRRDSGGAPPEPALDDW